MIGDPVNEAARLTDEAKLRPSRALASSASLQAAARDEQSNWSVEDNIALRGRATPTLSFSPFPEDVGVEQTGHDAATRGPTSARSDTGSSEIPYAGGAMSIPTVSRNVR